MKTPGQHAIDLGGHRPLLSGSGFTPSEVEQSDHVHVVVVPEFTFPQPTGGVAEIFDGEGSVEHSRHVRDSSLEIRDHMKRHAEIVGEVLTPVAAIALSEVPGVRIAVMVQNTVEQGVAQGRIDDVVFRLMPHDHLQQRSYGFVKLAFVIDSGVAHIRNG